MKRYILLLTLFCLFSQSCNQQFACTEEFRMIGLTVVGDELTDYFTIRVSNSDTIRLDDEFFPDQDWYPVLTDNYQSEIRNSQESFHFVGLIGGNVVVDEIFVISADACHIDKVSGPTEVVI